jgi:hypothetical protein
MSPGHLIAWLAAELYAIRAAVICWQLRTSSMPGESDLRYTPDAAGIDLPWTCATAGRRPAPQTTPAHPILPIN